MTRMFTVASPCHDELSLHNHWITHTTFASGCDKVTLLLNKNVFGINYKHNQRVNLFEFWMRVQMGTMHQGIIDSNGSQSDRTVADMCQSVFTSALSIIFVLCYISKLLLLLLLLHIL